MRIDHRRSERGSALFVAVLMLVMMGFLGVAALDTVSRDREVAGVQNRSRTAFYAAEAGLANARTLVHVPTFGRTSPPPGGFPTEGAPTTISDAGLYDREFALPSFYGDPNPTQPDPCGGGPMCFWKKGPQATEAGVAAKVGAGEVRIWDLYRINVIGESPDGSRARLESTEGKLASDSSGPAGGAYGGG